MKPADPQTLRPVRGFTLIELITVIAIVAVLAALAAPSFAEYFEKARLRGAADDVMTTLAQARAEAVKHNRDVRVDFGGTTTAWCVGANMAGDPASAADPIPAPTACDCTNSAQCLVGGKRTVANNSTYPGVTGTNISSAFIFDRSIGNQHQVGSDTPSSATTTLVSPTGHFGLRVDVSPLGHATACIPTGKAPISGFTSCP